jgi:hypothetical protein
MLKVALSVLTALAALSACTPSAPDAPQAARPSGYVAEQLAVKTMVSKDQEAAIAEPFVGVRTTKGIQAGLFPVRATGASTAPVTEAAQAFLATLRPDQMIRTVYGVEDSEWRRWFNVDNGIYVRQGVSLKEMNSAQRAAAKKLMQASLSERGYALTEAIRKTDQTLAEINNDIMSYDEDLYFFTVMGLPSPTEPWGWQIDGHHLVINYFVMGDQVVMTPTFLGGEPAVTRTGKYAGSSVLQDEQSMGLALMRSLDTVQRRVATLDSRKTGNTIQAEADKDNVVIEYSGVPVSTFSKDQKAQLMALIGRFIGTMRDDQAKVKMDEVEALLNDTWFGWVGDVSDDAVFYYRIHSPVVLIEFDHQNPVGTTSINAPGKPTRDHIHTVIRTPNGNDYGKDLLAQHLASHKH